MFLKLKKIVFKIVYNIWKENELWLVFWAVVQLFGEEFSVCQVPPKFILVIYLAQTFACKLDFVVSPVLSLYATYTRYTHIPGQYRNFSLAQPMNSDSLHDSQSTQLESNAREEEQQVFGFLEKPKDFRLIFRTTVNLLSVNQMS